MKSMSNGQGACGNSNVNGSGGPYMPNDYMGGEPQNPVPDGLWPGIWRGTL
jgi:hypothetical protein